VCGAEPVEALPNAPLVSYVVFRVLRGRGAEVCDWGSEISNCSIWLSSRVRLADSTRTRVLEHCVLKSVYFPDDLFLDATVGSSPSRLWRAIMDGKDILTQDIIRQIG
jgi:hypothetical protein